MGLLSWWRRRCDDYRRSQAGEPTIEINEIGFRLLCRRTASTLASVCWDSVRSIHTYKRDLFCYDVICVGFRTHQDGWVEVSEEMPGFDRLAFEEMPRHFTLRDRDWYYTVMLPAFEANHAVLWGDEHDRVQTPQARGKR